MAQVMDASIIIHKPVQEVWGFTTEINNFKFFWEGLKEVKFASEESSGEVGTKYFLVMKTLFGEKKIPIEISQKVATDNFEFMNTSNTANIMTGFRFQEIPEGTKVTMYRKSEIGPLASVLSLDFVSARGAQVEFKKILGELKKYLEVEGVSDPLTKSAMAKPI